MGRAALCTVGIVVGSLSTGCGGSESSGGETTAIPIESAATTTIADTDPSSVAPAPATTAPATTAATTLPPTTAMSTTTIATFDVAAWQAEWDAAREAFGDDLGAFSNQVNYLLDNNASDAQIAEAMVRLATDVADGADQFLLALDAASPVPEQRPDVTAAVTDLRSALVEERDVWRMLAACGPDVECHNIVLESMGQTQGSVGEALAAMPTE